MKKEHFKEKLKESYEKGAKLNFVRDICNCLNIRLYRAKIEIADSVFLASNFDKDFDNLWKLLTSEEKKYLKYYKQK